MISRLWVHHVLPGRPPPADVFASWHVHHDMLRRIGEVRGLWRLPKAREGLPCPAAERDVPRVVIRRTFGLGPLSAATTRSTASRLPEEPSWCLHWRRGCTCRRATDAGSWTDASLPPLPYLLPLYHLCHSFDSFQLIADISSCNFCLLCFSRI